MRAPEGAAPFTKAAFGWGDFDRWVQTGERGVPPQIATTHPFNMEGREISERMASVIGTIRDAPLPDEDKEPNPGWAAAVNEDRGEATNLKLPHDSVLLMSLAEGAETRDLEANLKKAVDRILKDVAPSKVITQEEWEEGMGPEPTVSQLLDRAELICQVLDVLRDGGQHADNIRAAWQKVRARCEREVPGAAAEAVNGSTPVPTQAEADREDRAQLAAAHALVQANAQAQDEAREHAEAAHTLSEVGVRGRSKAQPKGAAEVRARSQGEEAARRARDGAHRPLLPAGGTVMTHPPPPPPPPAQSQQPIYPVARAPPPSLNRPLLPSGFREGPPADVSQRPGEQQEGRQNPLFDHLRLPNPETERLHPVRAPMLPHPRFARPEYPRVLQPQQPLYDRVLYAPPASGPPSHAPYYAPQYGHPGQAPPPPPVQPSHPHHAATYAPHGSHTHHPPPPPPPPGPGGY